MFETNHSCFSVNIYDFTLFILLTLPFWRSLLQ
jgi:hypothetical protein